MNPKISVIMSVYNEEAYLPESMGSILSQTEEDFEVIVIDDCSADRSAEIIEGYHDPRIHLIRNEENRGLTKNLNTALEYCRGRYIARMDGDDISLPERFAHQMAYMDAHPDLMLTGTHTQTFGAQNMVWRLKDDPEGLRIRMLLRPVLAHPTFMMRRELIFEHDFRYDESFRSAQDYDLAQRVSEQFDIGIVPELLLRYRTHEKQVSSVSGGQQRSNADRVRERQLERLGVTLDEMQQDVYGRWAREEPMNDSSSIDSAKGIIDAICRSGNAASLYKYDRIYPVLTGQLFTWAFHEHSIPMAGKLRRACRTTRDAAICACTAAEIGRNKLKKRRE